MYIYINKQIRLSAHISANIHRTTRRKTTTIQNLRDIVNCRNTPDPHTAECQAKTKQNEGCHFQSQYHNERRRNIQQWMQMLAIRYA